MIRLPEIRSPRSLPYVLPMFVFLGLTSLEGQAVTDAGAPDPVGYPLLYALKMALATVAVLLCRSTLRDYRPAPSRNAALAGVVSGVLVIAVWIGLDGYYPNLPFSGARSAFDPTTLPTPYRILFFTCRFYGLVILVPVIEELFWRSWLMRWIINPEFFELPVGTVTPVAAAITAALFALAHPEWLPALLTGLCWALLLAKTRSLSACLISHMTANLVLGLYVVATATWRFW